MNLRNKLQNVNKESFTLVIQEGIIELHFYFEERNNAINVTNLKHFSSADMYHYNEEGIEELVNLYEVY
jgi:hypothetical protein